jgi:catechol 2,3-dioxygenase-like lactoylglutathione lyase family enzyme
VLRGLSTINLWADDLPAATRWYTDLLGVEPYFSSEAAGRGPGYVELASATTNMSWASSTGDSPRRASRPSRAARLRTGTSTTWRRRWNGWCRWEGRSSRE